MAAPLGDSAFWIMSVLAEGRRHGYAIVRDVEAKSGGTAQLKATTLYAVLDRLSGQDLVAADGDEVVEGRTRRYFRLTSRGADRLEREVDALAARVDVARAGLVRFRPAGAGA